MIYKVKMTVDAENDLDTIYSYIAFELRSPQIAAKQLGTMQNLISHFLLKNTVCLRVSASEMY